jgi:DNA-binding NtrC family response regulator
MVEQGQFREDLLYRLRVVPISLAPLRERPRDIPLLIDHIVGRLRLRSGKAIEGLSAAALRRLIDYDFPGNVRELENILERAFVLCHSGRIGVEHLPSDVLTPGRAKAGRRIESLAGRGALSLEARRLLGALEAHHWNRTRTAQALGIARNTLWRRMKAHGLL